jgi:predicted negative regulator of RcsB-dependent stress response
MAGQSAFEKRHVEASELSDVEGLLEHFNLPPNVITYLRQNKRIIQVLIAGVIIAVVSWALYGSYREQKIEDGATALALALKEPAASQRSALENVADAYSSTSSGTWAQVELAHLEMKEEKFKEAAARYSAVKEQIKNDNPLFVLALYGLAQAYEADADFEAAYTSYKEMKEIEGYRFAGYTGMARIHEVQGESDKALGIYGQYLTMLGEKEADGPARNLVEERIARIKAKQ